MALFDYDEITAIASDEPASVNVVLNPETRQLLLACFGLMSNMNNWTDRESGVTAEEEDDIDAMVSKAMEELLTERSMNTLKFSLGVGQADEAAVATYDFTDTLQEGSRQFVPYYGFRRGMLLRLKADFKATTENNRIYTFRPRFAGSNLSIIQTTFEAGTSYATLETDVMCMNIVSQVASFQAFSRLTVWRASSVSQEHYNVAGSANADQTAAHNFNLFSGWFDAPGGDSQMELSTGYLEIKRVE